MKRKIMVILAIVTGLCLGGLLLPEGSEAASKVKIDKKHFPDKIFREYVKKYDKNGDGYFSVKEREAVKKIELDNDLYPATLNLMGMDYFPKTEELTLIWCDVKNLRFDRLKNLKVVNLEQCKKEDNKESDKEYDFTANKKLKEVQIRRGNVKRILLAKNNKIEKFILRVPKQMKKVDLSRLSQVEELWLFDSEAESFNLKKCTFLKKAVITGNPNLTKLDFSANPNLEELEVNGNHLTSLNLSKNVKLKVLNVAGNYPFETLNISKLKKLRDLDCAGLQLKKLNLKGNPNLRRLDCQANQLETLDLSANTKLEYLNCSLNPLEELDISMLSELNDLNCRYGRLTSLDITKNEKLRSVDCEGNCISFIDFSYQMDSSIVEVGKAEMLQTQLLPPADSTPESGIPIDKEHFPDYALRYVVLADFDINRDGILSEQESCMERYLDLDDRYITFNRKVIDCRGVEYLKGIIGVRAGKGTILWNY